MINTCVYIDRKIVAASMTSNFGRCRADSLFRTLDVVGQIPCFFRNFSQNREQTGFEVLSTASRYN